MKDPYFLLIAVSLLVLLSYFFNVIAKQIRVPSVLLLIATGVGIRYLAEGVSSLDSIDLTANLNALTHRSVLTLVGQVGIVLIVLEGALDLELTKNRRPIIISAFWAALIILILSTVAIGLIIMYFLDATFLQGLVYGVPLSVISSAIIIPSVGGLTQRKKEFMVYESTISDILGIMFFNFLTLYDTSQEAETIALNVSVNLVVTLLISLLFALLLVWAVNKIRTNLKLFLTIAMLVLLYSTGKLLHYSSLLLIFMFGLVLNNINLFFPARLPSWLRPADPSELIKDFKTLTAETAFLVRTFFFVIFGLSINLELLADLDVIRLGAAITVVLYIVRLLNLLVIRRSNLFPEILMAPRGLVTVRLFHTIPQTYEIPGFGDGIMFFVIVASGLLMSLGLMLTRKQSKDYEDLELGAEPSAQHEALKTLSAEEIFQRMQTSNKNADS